MIYVEPQSGLCNRMRAIDSAIALGRTTQQNVTIVWQRNEDLNCALGDIFQVPREVVDVIEGNSGLGFSGRLTRAVLRYSREASCRLQGIPIQYLKDPLPGESVSADVVDAARKSGIYIRTCHRFYPSEKPFASLIPVPSVMGMVNEHTERLGRSVGVHIRRTDNLKSIAHSPLNYFIDAMREEQALVEGTQFFVATDSPETYRELAEVFGDIVFCHPKTSLSRSDPAAIIDAAVDLYCLANCRKLIGSYWSSFSEVAWQIRGIDKIIVNSE